MMHGQSAGHSGDQERRRMRQRGSSEEKRVAVWNFGPTHTHLQAEPGHPHLPDALHADPNAYHVPWEVQLSLHCERGRHLDGCKR